MVLTRIYLHPQAVSSPAHWFGGRRWNDCCLVAYSIWQLVKMYLWNVLVQSVSPFLNQFMYWIFLCFLYNIYDTDESGYFFLCFSPQCILWCTYQYGLEKVLRQIFRYSVDKEVCFFSRSHYILKWPPTNSFHFFFAYYNHN